MKNFQISIILLFGIFQMLSFGMFAQDESQHQVDSLNGVADAASTIEDKAENYCWAGMAAYNVSLELALKQFKLANKYFKQLPNSILNARNQDWMGYVYFRIDQRDSAALYYLKGIELSLIHI